MICHFSRKSEHRKEKSVVLFMHASKHSWMTLRMSRPLFVGSYLQVMWWAFGKWKRRTICMEVIFFLFFFFRISNQALLSQMKHLKNWRTAFVVLLLQLVLYSLLCFFLSCTCCGGHACSADIKAMFLKGIFVTYWSRVCQSFRYLRFSWSAEEQ